MPTRVLLLLLLVAGCASRDSAARRDTLTTRARESALAKSRLPGATGIGAALRVADSADARRKLEDSLAQKP